MTTAPAISTIAIFGERLPLWIMTALLARQLPEAVRIIAVENQEDEFALDVPDTGPKALMLDSENRYHGEAGIDDPAVMMAGGGVFTLGNRMSGWSGDGSDFFSAPSGKMPGINGVAFHHILLRAATMRGEPEKLADVALPFRFAARAGMSDKLTLASDDPKSPRTMLRPLMTVDSRLYADLLESHAKAGTATVEHIYGAVQSMAWKKDRQDAHENLATVTLSNGKTLKADLFIDVSGALSALLSGEMRDTGVTALFPTMPFDRICHQQVHSQSSTNSRHGIIDAKPDAVEFHTPLTGGHALSRIFRSGEENSENAQPLDCMLNTAPWSGNIVRAGLASASFLPSQSADFRLLQEQAIRVAALIPVDVEMSVERAEYNRLHNIMAGQLRDFQWLPFALNQRPDEHWKAAAQAPLPEQLDIRLSQFHSRGRFVSFDGEVFDEQEWIDQMIGLGAIPNRYDSVADTLDFAQVGQSLGQMVDAFTQTINGMPEHGLFMEKYLDAARQAQNANIPGAAT